MTNLKLRKILVLSVFAPVVAFADIQVKSPDGQIALTIDVQDNVSVYSVEKKGHAVINQSKLGMK